MTTDQPREGRQLPGAKTSEEEAAGIEQIYIEILDGTIELQHAIAPAGDVRLVVLNRSGTAHGLAMNKQDNEAPSSGLGPKTAAPSGLAAWGSIEPGDSAEMVVHLEEGDYTLVSTEAGQSRVAGTATLIVQPQQGLPGSGEYPGRSA